VTEDEIVAAIGSLLGHPSSPLRVTLGIGDDAALWQPSRSHRSVISTDMLVESVHFRRDTMPLEDAGWRAMAASLSDLAAMGARPVLATVAMSAPEAGGASDILALYRGVADASRRYKIEIAGGDLSRSNTLTISVTVVGEVRAARVKTRAGGRPGDVVAVTGELGASRAGLQGSAEATQAYRRPVPRIAEGRFLAASANVTAMMDCSDGLAIDLGRLCEASGCGAVIENVPVARPACETAERLGEDPERFALAGGEDFELIVAVRPRAFGYLAGRYERYFKKPLLSVGSLRRAKGIEWRGAPLHGLGWDHFA
jgi:thiamine-monophosphate kinase